MTSPDDVPLDNSRDGSRDDPAKGIPDGGIPDGPVEPGSPLGPSFDEDAAWQLIVENYGERAQLDDTSGKPASSGAVAPSVREPSDPAEPSGTLEPPGAGAFDRSYLDSLGSGDPVADAPAEHTRDRRRTDDIEHFVPPEPPPVPRATPARRLAWAGLFASPLLMILTVVFGWALPTWLSMLLVAAFVGGFVFLVVSMPRDGGDGWGDGAVV